MKYGSKKSARVDKYWENVLNLENAAGNQRFKAFQK